VFAVVVVDEVLLVVPVLEVALIGSTDMSELWTYKVWSFQST
jgi:hypothetical protein